MEGEGKARRKESEQCACWFPKSCFSGSPGRLKSAGDGTEPRSLSGLGLRRSLPAARSPPLSLPASQPAGARAPAPPPPTVAPPPTSREQETRGPAEGDQVGEAVLGEGGSQPAAVYLTAAADASDALWAQTAPRISRLGSSKTRGPTKQPASASLPGAPERNPVWLPLSMQLPSQLKPLVQDSHNPDILASHKTEQKPTNLTAPGL